MHSRITTSAHLLGSCVLRGCHTTADLSRIGKGSGSQDDCHRGQGSLLVLLLLCTLQEGRPEIGARKTEWQHMRSRWSRCGAMPPLLLPRMNTEGRSEYGKPTMTAQQVHSAVRMRPAVTRCSVLRYALPYPENFTVHFAEVHIIVDAGAGTCSLFGARSCSRWAASAGFAGVSRLEKGLSKRSKARPLRFVPSRPMHQVTQMVLVSLYACGQHPTTWLDLNTLWPCRSGTCVGGTPRWRGHSHRSASSTAC